VEEQKYRDKELKAKIFDVYSKYYDPSSDQDNCLFRLWELLTKWCRYYLFKKETKQLIEKLKKNTEKRTNEIGLEIFQDEFRVVIFEVVKRCTDKDKMSKKDFFPYLYTALVKAKNQYYRDQLTEDSLKESRTLKEIKGHIKTLKSNLGRVPTQDEQYNFIRQVMPEIKKEETIRDYLESLASTNVKLLLNTIKVNDGNELNIFDTVESHHSTYEKELMDDSIAEIFKDEFEKFLNEQQDRTMPFYRAIYTLCCIRKFRNYQKIRSILDEEILEICEKGEKLPTQAEIFLKYHPEDKKSTAEANASDMKNKFIKGFNEVLRKAIKEKHPNINF